MKRQLLPFLAISGGLSAVIAMIMLFSFEAAAARTAESVMDETTLLAFDDGRRLASDAPQSDIRAHWPERGQRPADGSMRASSAYPYPIESLTLHVNYAHDWIAGNAEIEGVTVALTVTNFDDSPKDNAVVSAVAGGDFFVGCDTWSNGDCPDIVPGDKVFAEATGTTAEINPVGHISGRLDEVADTVSGTLMVPGTSGDLDVTCQVWGEPGSTPITKTAAASGGTFSCDFAAEAGWDLARGDQVALSYDEGDGDLVTNIVPWPWARVNYGHDWAGMNYDLGQTFWLTVTDSSGAVKATAEVESTSGGGWAEPGWQTKPEDWTPEQPDIQPGDWVYFTSGNGYTNTVQVGTINGTLDTLNDRLDGQIFASQFGISLTVECHPWGAWDDGIDAPIKESWAEPDGSRPYSCQWAAAEWDILPNQEVAAMYLEPDQDRVINVFEDAPPALAIDKWSDERPVAGEDLRFTIEYWNAGGGPAAGVTISDTMLGGMVYISDTSGLSHTGSGSGPIVWDVGSLGPGAQGRFDVLVGITAAVSQTITNTAQITTITALDQGPPGDKLAVWSGHVVTPLPDLAIKKSYESSQLPQATVTYTLRFSNTGGTVASGLVISDRLPSNVTWLSGGNYDASSQSISWTWPSLAAGAAAEVEFSGQLACSGRVVNDDYLVVSSGSGISSPAGPEVAFDIISPTITVSFSHTAGQVVGGLIQFQSAAGTNGPAPLSYAWDFGDGGTGTGSSPNHVYQTEGEYTVVLTATDPCGNTGIHQEELVVSEPDIVAGFEQSAGAIAIDSSVQFTDTTSTNGADIVAWRWDFGDGSPVSVQQNPSHTYHAHDTFTVTLVVTDALGYAAEMVKANAVRTLAPVFEIGKAFEGSRISSAIVTFTLTVSNVGDLTGSGLVITDRLPGNVTWVSGGSYDGGIISWTWPSLAVGHTAAVQFSGRLACSGSVVNDRYRVAASDQGIISPWGDPLSFTIAPPNISAAFNQSARSIKPTERVYFTSTSTTDGPPLTTLSWDFDDGESGSGATVDHVFTDAGLYDVELTATDACGYEATVTHDVRVWHLLSLPAIFRP